MKEWEHGEKINENDLWEVKEEENECRESKWVADSVFVQLYIMTACKGSAQASGMAHLKGVLYIGLYMRRLHQRIRLVSIFFLFSPNWITRPKPTMCCFQSDFQPCLRNMLTGSLWRCKSLKIYVYVFLRRARPFPETPGHCRIYQMSLKQE